MHVHTTKILRIHCLYGDPISFYTFCDPENVEILHEQHTHFRYRQLPGKLVCGPETAIGHTYYVRGVAFAKHDLCDTVMGGL